MLAEYEAYEKSKEDFEAKCEEEEEASMNFQKLQEQQKLKKDMEALALLFEEMESDENKNQEKDI